MSNARIFRSVNPLPIKNLKIAGECCGVTRDVDKLLEIESCKLGSCLLVEPCSRRIDDCRVDMSELMYVLPQPRSGRHRRDVRTRETGYLQVPPGELACVLRLLDGENALVTSGERDGEESDACVEIEQEAAAAHTHQDELDELRQDREIRLKETARVEQITVGADRNLDLASTRRRIRGTQRDRTIGSSDGFPRPRTASRRPLPRLVTKPSQFRLERRIKHRTHIDRHDAVTGPREVSRPTRFGFPMPGSSGSIPPGIRRRDDVDRRRRLDPTNPFQAVFDDPDLGAELRLISKMLEIASSATPVIRAGSISTFRRGFYDLSDLREDRASSPPRLANTNPIAGRGHRNEKRDLVRSPDTVPSRNNAFDPHLVICHLTTFRAVESIRRTDTRLCAASQSGTHRTRPQPSFERRSDRFLTTSIRRGARLHRCRSPLSTATIGSDSPSSETAA